MITQFVTGVKDEPCAQTHLTYAPFGTGAKKEGQVNLYATASLTTTQAAVKAFEQKFSFVKVHYVRVGAENMLSKIRTEKAAGKLIFDVIYGGVAPLLTTLDVLQPYDSPEARAYADRFKDPKGLWTGFGANYYVFAYNTRKISQQEAPKSWEDFADPKWKGRIGMDPQEFRWLGALEEYLGEEKARRIMRGLARQDIQWRNNHTSLAQLMIAGEFDIALSFAHSIEELKEKRAPVEWVKTLKPIVVDIQAVALASNIGHPSAAKLLYDFLLSEDGAKVLVEQKKVPLRPGVLPPTSPLYPGALELFPTPVKVQLNMDQYAAKFEQIFGPRR
jgi:iron(III) transport system substrate-binding protein